MADRTYVVTGSVRDRCCDRGACAHGHRVVGVDQRDADVVTDLATVDGRAALVDGVHAATGGRIDAVIACAGISSGDPITVRVNFFGVVATLEGLRPLAGRERATARGDDQFGGAAAGPR